MENNEVNFFEAIFAILVIMAMVGIGLILLDKFLFYLLSAPIYLYLPI